MSDNLYAQVGGTTHMIASWPYGRADRFGELYGRASRTVSILNAFNTAKQRIMGDARLSPQAVKDDIRKAAIDSVRTLSTSNGLLYSDAQEFFEEQSAKAEVEPYNPRDVATVLIDLALAERLRTMNEGGKVLSSTALMADPRLLEAAARLPEALTGIKREIVERAINGAIYNRDPVSAQLAESMSEAISMAQHAHSKAFSILKAEAGLSLDEVRQAAGENYGLLSRSATHPTDPAPDSVAAAA